MFPISIEGVIELQTIPPQQVPRLVNALTLALDRARASDIVSIGTTISFRGGIFRFVPNWNILVPVSWGLLEVRSGAPGEIVFRFSCVQMLTIVTLISLVLAFDIPANTPLEFAYGVPVFAWLWLFGMNYLIAKFRLPAFVRRVAKSSL